MVVLPLFACGTQLVELPSGSSVTYEPVRREPSSPASLPAAPAFIEPPADTRRIVEVRRGGSVVRYEPILDLDADVHAHTSPSAPIEDEHEDATDSPHELPLEDRAIKPVIRPRANVPVDPSIFDVQVLDNGLALPYPTAHMFRGFGPCRGHRHVHEAIDLGGVGPDWGVGTPIRSMAKAEVIFVGTGDTNPDDFGTPDRRDGEAVRGDRKLPRWKDVEGYGRVYFFTSKKGRWRSGNIIVTRVLEGPLKGHTIRYLHVSGIHPDATVGAIIGRGQEIALMGGTGVQESAPHLHLDIQAPDGKRLDVAPLLGLEVTASCRVRDDAPEVVRAPKTERSRLDPPRTSKDTDDKPDKGDKRFELRAMNVGRCKSVSRREDFTTGRFDVHTTEIDLVKGQKVTVELGREKGTWKPRLQVDGDGVVVKTLASGKIGTKAVAQITARTDTSIRVTVGGWNDPPSDARYALSVSEKCGRGR